MDEYFMKKAYIEAQKARDMGEVPVGAIVVKDNRILSSAHNIKEKTKDPTAHAEIMAIKKASSLLGGWRLLDCTMYVTLEPCAMCAGAIVQSRVKRLVIGAKDRRMGACGSSVDLLNMDGSNHMVEFTSGVLEYDCSSLLSDFFKKLRDDKNIRNR